MILFSLNWYKLTIIQPILSLFIPNFVFVKLFMSITKLTLLVSLVFIGVRLTSQQTYQTYVLDKLTNKPIQGAVCILIQKPILVQYIPVI